jgi:hypothetical protein
MGRSDGVQFVNPMVLTCQIGIVEAPAVFVNSTQVKCQVGPIEEWEL